MKLHHTLLAIAGVTLAFHLPAHACNKAEMLKKFDANGDGQLDDTEKAAAKAAMQAKHAARKAEMLKKYDKNGDGTLDADEKAAAKADWKAAHPECKKHHKDDGDKPQPKSDDDKGSGTPDATPPPVL